jgi:hypothetical protein
MSQRIVLVWNSTIRLIDITVRYELYYRGFQKIGWDPIVVTTKASAQGFEYPVYTVDDPAVFRDPEFWAGLQVQVGLIINS